MEYVEAVLTSITLLKDTWSSISRCFNYRKILDKNCTTLKEKMDRLKCREQDVYSELQNAQYQRKKEKMEVENWRKEVQNMKDEVERMEGEARKQRCFSRLRLLKEYEDNEKKVDDLLKRGIFPEGILIDVVRDEGKALLVTQLTGETTAKRNMEKIWKFLKEGGTQSIGVWGMGGIGKTTIVTHIHNLLLEEKDTFGSVYWVTVSKDSSIRKLQDAIAEKINLHFLKEEDERRRCALLYDALGKEKKFVVIFDDVWEVYPPREVGIPIGAPDHGGGKLIITSRSKEVFLKMGCTEIIEVQSLCEEEAWKLFKTTLDRYNPLSQEEEKIAKDIVKECDGLPLAVVTTARSMSVVYDIAGWRNALNELKEHVKGHTIDMENDVFKILEFSYNRLNDLKLQECLVYCALFPEDYAIRRADLIGYWIVEGLVEEMGSRQAEYDRGHAILNKLENLCLLERCNNGRYVKMHDVVRDMAINITRRNSRFMVKIGRKLEDLPSETEWSNGLERVSLMASQLSSSMFVPDCPKLSTLLLQKHPVLPLDFFSTNEGLPNEFFMHVVGSLRVLDLSFTSITFLPDSIYDMVNLRAILLKVCPRLEQVRSLAKLKELRRLNLHGTNLERLPDGIEKMVHLKEFNWSRGSEVFGYRKPQAALVPHLLPNLLHLQCLTLNDERLFDVGAEELSRLRKLEILDVVFYNLHKFNSYVRKQHYQRLTHYRLKLNGRGYYRGFVGLSKEVIVSDHKLIGETEKEKENDEYYHAQLVLLPANLRTLVIINCELFPSGGLLDVSPSLKMAMDLKACEIIKCDGIEYVWWADDCIASSLNSLYLKDLPNLRVLFKLRPTENIASYSNSSLKHLFVGRCHSLKHLFTAELVKSHHLQNLHSISVYDCSELEDIIIVAEPEAAAEEEGIISSEMNNDLTLLRFPNLQSLKLARLPKLKSIWKQGKMTCDSLKQLSVYNCPNLQRLPLSMETTTNGDGDGERRASSPALKEIRGEKEWWDEVEWEPKSLFQSLFIPLEGRSSLFEEFIHDYEMDVDEIYEQV